MDEYLKTNQALWDKKTAIHLKTEFYDMDGFRSGKSSLLQFEREALGDVRGKSLLHLQCHFGQDSLSWARLGAKVTGIDFSMEAIQTARALNEELGLDASFVHANIYDLPDHLSGQFDIVFTSYGVLGWLPELEGWARVVRHFLKPGGAFYIIELHPAVMMFEFEDGSLRYPYFNSGTPLKETVSGTYADRSADLVHDAYFWFHSMSEIIGPLLRAGLALQEFEEYDFWAWNCFSDFRERAPGEYVLASVEPPLPHMFSLTMRG